jgi:diguanylate cyclase (GGDEF)-like protein
VNKEQAIFKIEYPCHSPEEERWFELNCIPFTFKQENYFLLQHSNITQKIEASINSNIDALTLVGNRRAFNNFLDKEWRRCSRSGHPISAIIIDIDNFKQFNDTYGHVEGDNCLKNVSQVLKELVHRPSDIFCRYGGEEFVYILGNTDINRALKLCEKIHYSVSTLNIVHSKPNNLLTVSVGLACVHPDVCNDKEHLIELADSYLYRAKSSGKNTTRFHNYQTMF